MSDPKVDAGAPQEGAETKSRQRPRASLKLSTDTIHIDGGPGLTRQHALGIANDILELLAPVIENGPEILTDGDPLKSEPQSFNVAPDAAPDAGAPHTGKDSVMTLDVDPKRARLLTALATMPEEAFGWLVVMLQPPKENRPHASPWPDGLGGFMDASRAAITETQAAAKAYIEGDGK